MTNVSMDKGKWAYRKLKEIENKAHYILDIDWGETVEYGLQEEHTPNIYVLMTTKRVILCYKTSATEKTKVSIPYKTIVTWDMVNDKSTNKTTMRLMTPCGFYTIENLDNRLSTQVENRLVGKCCS